MIVKKKSGLTGKVHEMEIPISHEKLQQWEEMRSSPRSPHIQDFFSELNANQREFILTGITPEEWDKLL